MSLRQLNFASLDLALHSKYTPGEGKSVFDAPELKEVIAQNSVMAPLPEDRYAIDSTPSALNPKTSGRTLSLFNCQQAGQTA